MTLDEIIDWARQNRIDFTRPVISIDGEAIGDLSRNDDGSLVIEFGREE